MDWKNIIKALRGPGGLTLREIGEAVGLSLSAISDLEKGRTLTTEYVAGTKLLAMHRRLQLRQRRREKRSSAGLQS